MKFTTYIGLGLALALAGTPALAFQEQQAGGSPEAPAAKAAAPATPDAKEKTLELSIPSPDAGSAAGTEVRIPGLGKLGVLPKMDFGLELLYGANETKQPDASVREEPGADDLTIRGTVKHNF